MRKYSKITFGMCAEINKTKKKVANLLSFPLLYSSSTFVTEFQMINASRKIKVMWMSNIFVAVSVRALFCWYSVFLCAFKQLNILTERYPSNPCSFSALYIWILSLILSPLWKEQLTPLTVQCLKSQMSAFWVTEVSLWRLYCCCFGRTCTVANLGT